MSHNMARHSSQPGADGDLTARATVPELAELMRLSRGFVYERVASGRWPCHRAGGRLYFTQGDLAEINEITRQPPRDQPAKQRPRRRPEARTGQAPTDGDTP